MPETLITPASGGGLAVPTGRPVAVSIAGASKSFKLPRNRASTLKERVLQPRSARSFEWLHAVRDVTVDVEQGEFFGIVGRNGSGKSTLLKCLAGIYRLDAGTIKLRGSLSPFIELGVGFNMEMTARDNVIINAIMLGLSRREAIARFDEVIDFAELHDFLDLKVKNYSSGMLVRLAFSVSILVRADVLLIDEVLAVGDANFQQKCFDELERLKRQGRTVLFVTHDMASVERFCDRAMLMSHGQVLEIGDPATVARNYNKLNFASRAEAEDASAAEPEDATADVAQDRSMMRSDATILDVWCEDEGGARVDEQEHGHTGCLAMEVEFNATVQDPIFTATLHNLAGTKVFSASSQPDHRETGTFRAGQRVTARLRYDNWLAAGRYVVEASIARHGTGADVLDYRPDAVSIVIFGARPTLGVVDLPSSFEVTPQ
jgi:ABC-type polysaccharide/polyol phosphate transport system ATPase subunit